MWTTAGIVIVASVVAAIQIPLLKNKKKELWVFSLLLALATGLGIARGLKVDIPSPLYWIAYVFGPFTASN